MIHGKQSINLALAFIAAGFAHSAVILISADRSPGGNSRP
jgi:hypothetical protein